MASLTVRDINADDYEALRRVARANKRSTAAQIRSMIAELSHKAVGADQAIAELLEFRKRYAIKPRSGEDAVSMIRATRDS